MVMVLEQKVVEVYAHGFIRLSKSPAGAPRQVEKGLILPEDFLLADASMGFHLQKCRHTVCREGAHLGEFTQLQVSYLLICFSKSPSRLPALRDYSSVRTVAFDYVSIPTKESLLPRIGRVRLGRPWLEPKSVRNVQVFIRLLSMFYPEVEDHRVSYLNTQDKLINRLIS